MVTTNDFWVWFQENEKRFRDLEVPDREELLDEILVRLQEVCEGLWFEVGEDPDGLCEFVITAEGNRDFLGKVKELAAAAPPMDGWVVVPFKPAMGFDFCTDFEGVRLDPKELWFLPLASESHPEALGLRIGVPGYDPGAEPRVMLAACLKMLDTGLGERAAAEDIQHVEVAELPEDPGEAGWIELPELGDYIAWRKQAGS